MFSWIFLTTLFSDILISFIYRFSFLIFFLFILKILLKFSFTKILRLICKRILESYFSFLYLYHVYFWYLKISCYWSEFVGSSTALVEVKILLALIESVYSRKPNLQHSSKLASCINVEYDKACSKVSCWTLNTLIHIRCFVRNNWWQRYS